MARPTKLEEDRKVKFGISLDRDLFDRMVKEKIKNLWYVHKKITQILHKRDIHEHNWMIFKHKIINGKK